MCSFFFSTHAEEFRQTDRQQTRRVVAIKLIKASCVHRMTDQRQPRLAHLATQCLGLLLLHLPNADADSWCQTANEVVTVAVGASVSAS